MNSRALTIDDIEQVKKIHEKHFPGLEFPDFMSYLNSFIIEDNDGKTILAGGVKLITETYLITDLDTHIVTLGRALAEAHRISYFTNRHFKIKESLAFTFNDNYASHLLRRGYRDRNGRSLSLEMP